VFQCNAPKIGGLLTFIVQPPKFGAGLPATLAEAPAIVVPAAPHVVAFCATGVRSAPLVADRPVLVGRAPECDLCIDLPLLSRAHFAIHLVQDGATDGVEVRVEDLKSANGTKIAGMRLPAHQPIPVAAGTLIEAGGVFFLVRAGAEELGPQGEGADASASAVNPNAAIVVADPAMTRLHDLIDLVARSAIPVLVVGETGVGKEVISVEVHRRSARADRPLVSLNCAALAESLLESELFGFEKGSFTGATQAKQGLLEAAHEGTLFLDEVGEMPLATQAKLLRVLENGELLRIGAVKPKKIDVRFIAATNRNLPAEVANGTFRRDLYYRLNGITIPVPPLRERPGEIPPLVRHLLADAAKKAGRATPKVPEEVMDLLVGHRGKA
jgi:pSer/pThr/pTyr-binding forkhead associated (FHA) protein